jgi:hypothetical protein
LAGGPISGIDPLSDLITSCPMILNDEIFVVKTIAEKIPIIRYAEKGLILKFSLSHKTYMFA